jgi:FKBP-type peptidyl-prolyl cis-trans isomerase
MTRRTTSRALVALALATALTACGSDSGDDPTLSQPSAAPTTSAPTASAPRSPSAAASAAACEQRPGTAPAPAGAVTDLKTKPTITGETAAPPCGLVLSDIVVGTGPEAKPTDTVDVKYVGAFYESGEEFDTSWGSAPGDKTAFPLNRVIPGFSQGIAGMKVGSRRQITVPSGLGYGPQGSPPTIPPNATLVFVVDLVGVTPGG